MALTTVDPTTPAGAEALAEMLAVPILASPTRAGDLPYEVEPLADGDTIDLGDVPIRVVATPGPTPDHLAFIVGDGRLVARRRPRRQSAVLALSCRRWKPMPSSAPSPSSSRGSRGPWLPSHPA